MNNQAIASELVQLAQKLIGAERTSRSPEIARARRAESIPDLKDLEDWVEINHPDILFPHVYNRGRNSVGDIDPEALLRFWRDKGSPEINLSTPQQRKIKNKNILKFFSFQRSYEDRIYDFSNSQFEAFIKILKKVYKDAPSSLGGSEDHRPGSKVFRSNMVKWMASYYHDGGLMDIRLNSDSDFSKLRSMV
tara:strand:+ start:59 stop:634 length:576 start_codon:yes stop_codon:yes gene_type:complete